MKYVEYSYLRLQGDCHPGNILWRDGPFIVDFDYVRNGPAIQDLWMLLNGERREQQIQLEIYSINFKMHGKTEKGAYYSCLLLGRWMHLEVR